MCKIFSAVLLAMAVFNSSLTFAESEQICFANLGEFICIEAESTEQLIKKVEALDIHSGEYYVFIEKSVAWTMKRHFSKDNRIESANLISKKEIKLPHDMLQKIEAESSKSYYFAKVVIKQ